MDFEFQISPYNNPSFIQQVSHALESRTEFISREKHPQIWKIADYFNLKNVPKVSEAVLKRRRSRYRIYGILLIIMGIFLFVPGLMEPQELLVPFVVGIIGILVGGFTLWSSVPKKQKNNQFDQAAIKLLKDLEVPPSVRVQFTQDGMKIADQQIVPYSDFNFVCETEDLFLLTWNERVSILQKQDMVTGNKEQFISFLKGQIKTLQQ